LVRSYDDTDEIRRLVDLGEHRAIVGGMWDEIGRLAFDFLVGAGLQPGDRLLDVGCGALRVGVHLVRYLDPGNYYGIDLQEALLDAGYEHEIVSAGLSDRLPRENLRPSGAFEAGFAAPVDLALALSVFTHLPWNHLRLSLERLANVVRPGGRYFVTYFEASSSPDVPFGQPQLHDPGGITTYPASDPFHYRQQDIAAAASGTPWTCEILGEWHHPRDQRMALFTRCR
jgi:SAM-dependent methyltransferase